MSAFFVRLLQCLRAWGKPPRSGKPEAAQVILVQTVSDLKGGRPSETNLALAKLARKYHEQLGVPVFPQVEVGRILEEWGVPVVGSTPVFSEIPVFAKGYAGTHGIARLQKEFCDSKAWRRALVLAAWPHAWRAIWNYERIGLEVIVPPDLPKMKFERQMSQARWRQALTAYPYEFLARLFYLKQGLI